MSLNSIIIVAESEINPPPHLLPNLVSTPLVLNKYQRKPFPPSPDEK